MRPRILHLYKDYYPPVRGGIEQTINLMANGLKDDFDVSVLVCCGNSAPGEEDIDGIRVIRSSEIMRIASAPISTSYISMLRKELQQTDLIHLHHPNPTNDLALAMCGNHNKPMVMTYHSDIVRQKISKYFIAPFLSRSMNRCSIIMPTSPDYVESSKWLQHYQNKLEVVPLGIHTQDFLETKASSVHTRDYKKLAQNRRIISFNGRLRYYKGLPWAINAMKHVNNATFMIAGDGPIRNELEELAVAAGVTDRVIFLGNVTHEELVGLLHASDVFCMPSHLRSEALGISMIEAMTCGLPIVSCDVPSGVRFVNVDGVTGIRVPPCNALALADAFNKLLSDEGLRLRTGQNAAERARGIFSAEEMNRHLRSVYCTVLNIN